MDALRPATFWSMFAAMGACYMLTITRMDTEKYMSVFFNARKLLERITRFSFIRFRVGPV